MDTADETIEADTTAKEQKEAKELAPQVIKTILQEGVDFEITVKTPTILHRLRILQKTKKFIIYPMNMGSLFNISGTILEIAQFEPNSDDDLFTVGIKNIVSNNEQMLEIMALAILNRRLTAITKIKKWWLKRYLRYNLTPSEMLEIVRLSIAQMEVTDFLASIVSIKRLNMVEAMTKDRTQTTGDTSAG